MQAAAVQVSENKEIISLWLSPSLRSRFREQAGDDSLSAQFQACELETIQCSLWEGIVPNPQITSNRQQVQIPDGLRKSLETYVKHYDIIQLYAVVQDYHDWNFVRVLDTASAQAYLLISDNSGKLPVVMNLTGAVGQQSLHTHEIDVDSVSKFVRSRALWLEGVSQ